jgi:hypothetical protein
VQYLFYHLAFLVKQKIAYLQAMVMGEPAK